MAECHLVPPQLGMYTRQFKFFTISGLQRVFSDHWSGSNFNSSPNFKIRKLHMKIQISGFPLKKKQKSQDLVTTTG